MNNFGRIFKLSFLYVFSIMIIGMPILHAGEIIHEFHFDINKIKTDSVYSVGEINYTVVQWDGMSEYGEPGSPRLPILHANLVVPTLSNNYRVSVIESLGNRLIPLEHMILPIQEQIPINNIARFQFTEPSKSQYSIYSIKKSAQYVNHVFIDGDTKMISIVINPFAYDMSNSNLEVCEKMTIKVSYDECTKEEAGLLPDAVIMNRRNIELSKFVVNPKDYRTTDGTNKTKRISYSPKNIGEYCIITTEKLAESFDRLALWKRQKGYNVTVKTVESICSDPLFRPTATKEREDSAASVRAFIKTIYDQSENGHVFCLLAGHYDDGMPIRWIKSTIESARYRDYEYRFNKFGECYIPTDAYFCDVLSSWNLVKDENADIYTNTDINVSPSLLVNVGRIMCKNAQEAANYIDKLIIYECNPGLGDKDYLGKFAQFVEFGLEKYYDSFYNSMSFFGEKTLMLDEYISNKSARSPKGKDVIDILSQVGFSSWMGHGNPASVCTTGPGWEDENAETWKNYAITALDCYAKTESGITPQEIGNGLDNLDNFNKPGVAYAISCDITPFDKFIPYNGKAYDIKYNMGESYTVGGLYGGVALFGNTRVGYTSSSSYLQNSFAEALGEEAKAGIVENYSKQLFLSNHGDMFGYHVIHTNNLIGDPEFEIWRGNPLFHDVSLEYSMGKVNISGTTLSDAVISVYDGFEIKEIFVPGSIQTNLSMPSKSYKMLLCSIWKTGTIPVITLLGENSTITEKFNFIVGNAKIGLTEMFKVLDGGVLNIEALNLIEFGDTFCISDGGKVSFSSKRKISAKGGIVGNNGSLRMTGDEIVLNSGFTVEKGGSLLIE